MLSRSRRVLASPLALGIYLVGVALVVSFVLFEVLDVDGSNFSAPVNAATVAPEPIQPVEIKRTISDGLTRVWIDPTGLPAEQLGASLRLRWRSILSAVASVSPGARAHRELLPRAHLADPLPTL